MTDDIKRADHNYEEHLSLIAKPTWRDKCNVAVTLALPIILMASLVLTGIYVLHPIPMMVNILPNFSLSLPVVACGGAGIGLTFILLLQICRHKSVVRAFSRIDANFFRSSIHKGRRANGKTAEQFQNENSTRIQAMRNKEFEIVSMVTRDYQRITLKFYWHAAENMKQVPTIIIFHGNMGSAAIMSDWGSYYKQLGFNVLLAEYRGYGLSEGAAAGPNQEIEAYLDAEAALKFVLDQGIPKENVVAQGFSLGGAYAASLGYFFGVQNIILDHTFTSFGAIIGRWLPFINWDEHISTVYTHTKIVKHPEIEGSKDIVTDGFNTLSKIRKMDLKARIFVIRGEKDHMMPLSCGDDFLKACYNDAEESSKMDFVATIKGGHNYSMDLLGIKNEQKIWKFLYPIGEWDRFRFPGLVDSFFCLNNYTLPASPPIQN